MKPELILEGRAEQRFALDSLAEIERARAVLKAQIAKDEDTLTLLDFVEKSMQPAAGVG